MTNWNIRFRTETTHADLISRTKWATGASSFVGYCVGPFEPLSGLAEEARRVWNVLSDATPRQKAPSD